MSNAARATTTLLAITLIGHATTILSADRMPITVSFCQLAQHGQQYDKQLVRIRAQIETGVEYVRLFSSLCPHASIFVGESQGGTFGCSDPAVSRRFGCPLRYGVNATLKGQFRWHNDGATGQGTLDVEEIGEYAFPKQAADGT